MNRTTKGMLLSLYLVLYFSLSIMFVNAAHAESLSITWDAPTTRENGAALAVTEISGYTITASYPNGTVGTIDIPSGATTSYDIPIIYGAGIYEFTITATDTDGLTSASSDVASIGVDELSRPVKINSLRIKVVCQAGSVCTFIEIQPALQPSLPIFSREVTQ